MKNYLLLALIALGVSAQIAADYDHENFWERHEDRVAARRERRAHGERNPGVVGVASDVTHGVLGGIGL